MDKVFGSKRAFRGVPKACELLRAIYEPERCQKNADLCIVSISVITPPSQDGHLMYAGMVTVS